MKFNNPEKSIIEGEGSKLSEAEERLFPILVPEIEKERIQIHEFEGLYDPAILARDQQEVDRLESIFSKQNENDPEANALSKRGKLFEAIVNNQIESSNWLGENASVIIPSKYDDYINKIDTILEFDTEGSISHMALAIDVTKSRDDIQKKLAQITSSIKKGQLSTVRYFRSQTERAEKSRIPRVVIGADQKTMNDLAELLLRFQALKGKNQDEFKKIRAKLEKHPAQLLIILEIRNQLSAFKKYALEVGKEDLIPAFDALLDLLNPIFIEIKSDEDYLDKIGRVKDDEVFNMIIEESKKIGQASID